MPETTWGRLHPRPSALECRRDFLPVWIKNPGAEHFRTFVRSQSYERDTNPAFVGQASTTYKQIGTNHLFRNNPSPPKLFIEVSEGVSFFWDLLVKSSTHAQYSRAVHSPAKPAYKTRKMLPADRRRSQSAASERYRQRNREAVLQAGRERSVRRRAALKSLKPGDKIAEPGDKIAENVRQRAREASARYRAKSASNRELLAAKQRTVRKKAYIKKYGYSSYVMRSLNKMGGR
ncbi:hypothetical protein B0H14DRAFT_2585982 [Mycena olivaceomarginata]|nr:hypothetical protein B0H14DRAFT_2585982 [Mycena olivaceomarginata]